MGMKQSALREYIRGLKPGLLARWHRLDALLLGAPGVFFGALGQMLQFRTTLWAASIAYFALLAIFPLTLLSIAIASYSLGPSADLAAIIGRLEFLVPTLGDLMSENIAGVIRAKHIKRKNGGASGGTLTVEPPRETRQMRRDRMRNA